MKKFIVTTLLLAAMSGAAIAQKPAEETGMIQQMLEKLKQGIMGEQPNETSMTLQIRPRAEYRNGAFFPRTEDDKPAFFVNNRARLSIDYRGQGLSMKVSAQHVGVWGQDAQTERNGRAMLNEAWARVDFNNRIFMQLGRMPLAYDNERLLGGLDWNPAGRFHDALRLGYEDMDNKLHLILAYNQNGENTSGTYYNSPGGHYKSMQTIWFRHNTTGSPFAISLLMLNVGREAGTEYRPNTLYLCTAGAYATYTDDIWKLNVSAYYQGGKNPDHTRVSAYMLSAGVNCTLNSEWQLVLGSDYLSGDKEDDEKFRAFNPLFGTHHKFYGTMDYFFASGFVDGYNPGLWDSFAGLNLKAGKKTNLSLTSHYFRMAGDITINDEVMPKELGVEIDFQVDWAIRPDVKLAAGYSTMIASKPMDTVKGGDYRPWQEWGWLSLNINPRIFFAKW